MRKLLVLLIIMNAMLAASAAETQDGANPLAAYDGYWSDSSVTNDSSAAAVFTLDLRSFRYIRFEFRKDGNAIDENEGIALSPADDGTAGADLTLHYDVVSSDDIGVYLNADGKIRRNEDGTGPVLDWSLADSADAGKVYFNTENAEGGTSEDNRLDIGFKEGDGKYSDNISLTVQTESYADLPLDSDYYANIILTIKPD